MYSLDYFRIATLDLTNISLSMFDVLLDLVNHVFEVLVLKRELLFEFVDDLLASIDKDRASLVNGVDLLDGLLGAILAYERSVSEFEVPRNGIKIVKS